MTLRFIDGKFTKGAPFLVRDFREIQPGTVVWAKAVAGQLDGTFQVLHRFENENGDDPAYVITDADNMGIYVSFPNSLSSDTHFGFAHVGVGQINFFRAEPVLGQK